MNKRSLLSILFFLTILGSSLLYVNLDCYVNAPGYNDQPVNIIVKRGYSVKKIGKELVERNVIAHPKIFYLVHRLFFRGRTLQAGEYEIPAHASIREIIKMIHQGSVLVHKLTITEGITNKEVIDHIAAENMLVGDITKEFHEGDFLADTYYYTYGESKMMVLNRIYKKSQAIIEELWEKRQENLPISSKQEAVTLASIVEKETGIASERPRIAGVFINRLKKKMKLQADPTVIYAVTQGQYVFNREITLSDLKIKSPYNTYLYEGLPPTAIASPGRAAIEAVLNPMETNELYFVANGKGGHNFSASLSDHNNHVRNYRNAQ